MIEEEEISTLASEELETVPCKKLDESVEMTEEIDVTVVVNIGAQELELNY